MDITLRTTTNFLVAFISSAIILGVLTFVVMMSQFTLSPRSIADVESSDLLLLFLSLLLLSLGIRLVLSLYKNKRKDLAAGIGLVLIAVFYLSVAAAINCSKHFFYKTDFDQQVWKSTAPKPYGMARMLVENKILSGLNEQQIREKLGDENFTRNWNNGEKQHEQLLYQVENEFELRVIFKNNMVYDVALISPGADL